MKFSDNTLLISVLNEIFNSNADFASTHDEAFFDSFRNDQNPRITILTCSDSRVQMESFDNRPENNIFAIRNIGNQVNTCEGSIDFGIKILKTPFLLVIGHSGCGAIKEALSGSPTGIQAIDNELKFLKLSEIDIKSAIVENVHNQVGYAMNKYHDLIETGNLIIIGAIYDFKNDFGFGKGKLIALSINSEKNGHTIRIQIADKVKNFKFLDSVG